MKTFAIILVLGFTSQVSNAFYPTESEPCMIENGFPNSDEGFAALGAVANHKEADKLKNVPKEKLAAAVACLFPKEYKKTSLYGMLKSLTNMAEKVTDEQRSQMMNTLNTCNEQAKGNDADLLVCINAFEPPFDYFIYTLDMLGEQPLNPCYEKCGLQINDLFALETFENKIHEILKRVPLDKVYCASACRINNQDNPTNLIYQEFKKNVEEKEQSEEKKTMIKGMLERCYTEGGYKKEEVISTLGKLTGEDNTKLRETYQLLKCLKIFEAPILDEKKN